MGGGRIFSLYVAVFAHHSDRIAVANTPKQFDHWQTANLVRGLDIQYGIQ